MNWLSKLNPINWLVGLFTNKRASDLASSFMAFVGGWLTSIGAPPEDVADFKMTGGKVLTFVVVWAVMQGASFLNKAPDK